MINKTTYLLELYAPGVLRIGMSAVILWFSIQQFLHNSVWVAYIPDSIVSLTHLSASNLVFLNAVFELVFGLALMFGWYTRFTSLLLALHLFDIMWVVGYGEIGVRDLGLAIGTFVVFMNGADIFSIDQKKDRSSQIQNQSNSSQPGSIQPNQNPLQNTSQNYSREANFSSQASQGIRRI